MLSCEIIEIIKNAYFEEHLRTIASGVNIFLFNIINLITSNDFSRPACQSCSSQKICCAITLFFLARQSPISQDQFLITLFFLFLKCHGSYKIIVDDSKCNIYNKILMDVLRQKVFLLNYRKAQQLTNGPLWYVNINLLCFNIKLRNHNGKLLLSPPQKQSKAQPSL